MNTLLATIVLIFAGFAAHTQPLNAPGNGPPTINCPGNSCGNPSNGPTPIVVPSQPSPNIVNRVTRVGPRLNTRVINHQANVAPVTSIISGTTIRATAGVRSSARLSGNTIAATAIGNHSVVRIRRGARVGSGY